jgi:hypothetical protein
MTHSKCVKVISLLAAGNSPYLTSYLERRRRADAAVVNRQIKLQTMRVMLEILICLSHGLRVDPVAGLLLLVSHDQED